MVDAEHVHMQQQENAMGYTNPDHGLIDERSDYPAKGITSMACVDRNMGKSQPAWSKRLWGKPTDYSHRMEYDSALSQVS